MDVDVTKTPNHTECIRCGMCINACPTGAISFRYGLGNGKESVLPLKAQKTCKPIAAKMTDQGKVPKNG